MQSNLAGGYYCLSRLDLGIIARENNYSTISNETEYFITDIEFADSSLKARFDLLAIRWLATQRGHSTKCRLSLLEMKYGDGALGGEAGLLKHLQDCHSILTDREKYENLLATAKVQFEQLYGLGLINLTPSAGQAITNLAFDDKPEVIFILANHNPRSTQLRSLLSMTKLLEYSESEVFDLKFFVSSFAGYGLHADCMLTLAEFQKMLKA